MIPVFVDYVSARPWWRRRWRATVQLPSVQQGAATEVWAWTHDGAERAGRHIWVRENARSHS